MTYRKISQLPLVIKYPFAICMECGEIFENDTQREFLYCPNDKSLLVTFLNEEAAKEVQRDLAKRGVPVE